MALNTGAAAVAGKRRHRRRPVMSEINVTPMVDVMLVLLIIFMVSASLFTVGVKLDLPETQAKSLDENREPLKIAITDKGKILLQEAEIAMDDLVTKLNAIRAARANKDEPIYVIGDKAVTYDVVAKVMGLLQGAGFLKVVLVTLPERR
ncbi:MAG: biopolymer transport protein TolR [Alphaproteobacteria bacterium]|jgi:biopolymer transport protein TolR|nr:biopolymer transport protein TolR [Alphaproteobacteria bacterium]